MVIYQDFHRPPMFLSLYEESGVSAQNRYASGGAMVLARHTRRFLPQTLFYRRLNIDDDDDKIIVFDSGSSPYYLNWLLQRHPNKRIILFFWNPISNYPFDLVDPRVEIWTYSKTDSLKHNIKFNSQFYFDVLADEAKDAKPSSASTCPKILFAGREKGRVDILNDLRTRLSSAGAEVEQFLVPPPKHLGQLMEKTVPYREIVKMVKQTDIILDYTTIPDAGFSLRIMEALFWGKKLITNNISVLDSGFYHPENIYVLGKDERTFEEFFSCDPQPVDPAIQNWYRLSSWLKRFEEVMSV